MLICGEPDASSFPFRRPAFHLRGPGGYGLGCYKARPISWKNPNGNILVHSTMFLSWTGELPWTRKRRSCDPTRPSTARPRGCWRFLASAQPSVVSYAGLEQEYFSSTTTSISRGPISRLPDVRSLKGQAGQGPGIQRPVFWRHSPEQAFLHDGSGKGSLQAGRAVKTRATTRPRQASTRLRRFTSPATWPLITTILSWPRCAMWPSIMAKCLAARKSPSAASTVRASMSTIPLGNSELGSLV